MEPGQYTGKSDATQGTSASDGAADGEPRTTAPRARGEPSRPGESVGIPRAVLWFAVAAALVAGVALYFRYERAITPLFGGGR